MRKAGIVRLAAFVLLCVSACAAHAQAFPNKPVKLVVPFPPGGNIDFIARTIQPGLTEYLGQPIIIDNKGGASGIIGAEYAAKQPADGYTVFVGNTGTLAINLATYSKLPYDTLRDFTAIGQTTTNAQLLAIHPGVPANTLKEFVAYIKANPGKVNCGVAGTGSSLHFASEMFKRLAGLDMQLVFYKGSGPTVADLLGGQVQLMIDAPPVTMNHIKAGKLKAIAVTGQSRLRALPEVPTFDEGGVSGFDAGGFQGIVVPAGTPPAAIARLSDALMKTLAKPAVRETFAVQGLDVAPSTPEQFNAYLRAEIAKWGRLAREANIRAD